MGYMNQRALLEKNEEISIKTLDIEELHVQRAARARQEEEQAYKHFSELQQERLMEEVSKLRERDLSAIQNLLKEQRSEIMLGILQKGGGGGGYCGGKITETSGEEKGGKEEKEKAPWVQTILPVPRRA